ncbi:ParM/StbA family protein [Clostridium faecium]|uniref:ParM/StbA family protein n=1 Tax=Clostridium faecium TaxID=2762223 RepID=A0ABR8YNL1_9CLOT|nr:ParM/StbA family protein [Clostridium faecium]MBD8045827.1 ParM/StbA family protein [Clostridium faecium]
MKIIGVDNGNTVVKTSEGIEFENKVAAEITEINKEDIKVIYEGNDYTLGVETGSANISRNRHLKIQYKISLLTSIAKSFTSENNIECKVVVGTPVELFNNKGHVESIKNTIMQWGPQKITVNNVEKSIKILDTEIFPEAGIVFSDKSRFKDEKTLIIDLGGSTVDISLWNGLRLETFKTYKEGMVTLYTKVITKVNKEEKTDLRNSQAKYMINKDEYMINQKLTNIQYIKPVVELYVNNIISEINQNFELDKVNSIQLIGGGAIMLFNYFKEEYANAELVDNAAFANANTFKKIGEAIWL